MSEIIIPQIKYLPDRPRTTEIIKRGSDLPPFISFTPFKNIEFSFMTHGFSTRLGGVSEGIFESLNFASGRGDDPDNILENFKRIGVSLGDIPAKDMVYAKQTHTVNVLHVTEKHRGMGVTRERDFDNIDALVTDTPGVCLVAGFADCIPLFFADPVKQAIGLAHSGWRGTIGNIAAATIKKMTEDFGCNPKDISAYIGPGICRDHYEVSKDVADEFIEKYSWEGSFEVVTPIPGSDEKYLLDLHHACYINILRSGVPSEKIFLTDICTCCNPDLLFSHRFTGGRRGGLCGFMMKKDLVKHDNIGHIE